jgi:hypothetical protein
MSRIYIITDKTTKKVARYVRANSLNAAVRALIDELYSAETASTDQMFAAMKAGNMDVLDAVEAVT